jgi:hypothetical protein
MCLSEAHRQQLQSKYAIPKVRINELEAEEVRILSLPPVAQGQKTGLDEFILARKEQALLDLQDSRGKLLRTFVKRGR